MAREIGSSPLGSATLSRPAKGSPLGLRFEYLEGRQRDLYLAGVGAVGGVAIVAEGFLGEALGVAGRFGALGLGVAVALQGDAVQDGGVLVARAPRLVRLPERELTWFVSLFLHPITGRSPVLRESGRTSDFCMTKYDKKSSESFGFTPVVRFFTSNLESRFRPVLTRVWCVFAKLCS